MCMNKMPVWWAWYSDRPTPGTLKPGGADDRRHLKPGVTNPSLMRWEMLPKIPCVAWAKDDHQRLFRSRLSDKFRFKRESHNFLFENAFECVQKPYIDERGNAA